MERRNIYFRVRGVPQNAVERELFVTVCLYLKQLAIINIKITDFRSGHDVARVLSSNRMFELCDCMASVGSCALSLAE